MKKPLYNQGDLLHWAAGLGPSPRFRGRGSHLLVITDVFTSGLGEKYADIYYSLTWVDDGSKKVYQIKTIDGDPNFKLLARG